MRKYRDYQPTCFDPKGAFLTDQGDWYVAPVIRTRDSGPYEESNFQAAIELLGGEGENVEIHRFGHWGPGWFEVIIVRPETKEQAILEDIIRKLEDYPLLDDEDFSRREYEKATETWEGFSVKDRIDLCRKHGISIFAARRPELPQDDDGRLYEYLIRD